MLKWEIEVFPLKYLETVALVESVIHVQLYYTYGESVILHHSIRNISHTVMDCFRVYPRLILYIVHVLDYILSVNPKWYAYTYVTMECTRDRRSPLIKHSH